MPIGRQIGQGRPWSQPWEHIQLDICGELKVVPHHQRFLLVTYNLHSKWPEVAAAGTVTAGVLVNILDSLFARWGLPKKITTDKGAPNGVSRTLFLPERVRNSPYSHSFL